MELDKKRPYDHYKDGHVGGGTNAKDSKCIVPLRLKVDKSLIKTTAEKGN